MPPPMMTTSNVRPLKSVSFARKPAFLSAPRRHRPARIVRGCSDDLVVQPGLVPPQPIEVVIEHVEDRVLVAMRIASGVRRDQRTPYIPERRVRRQRLLNRDVDPGAGDPPRAQRLDQRRLVGAVS